MNKKHIFWFLVIYITLRIFTFFFGPETPLYSSNPVNTFVSAFILLITIYLLIKKDERAWFIILGEIVLGGSGAYLNVGFLSLRTLLLFSAILIYTIQKIQAIQLKQTIIENKYVSILILVILTWVGFSDIRGYLNGHDLKLIISDTIPYLFFLYFFPLKDLFTSEKFKNTALNMLVAAIIGNFMLVIFTFIGFSSGLIALQDSYYHWFRDIASGKITNFDFNFYRIVLNEHLLLTPLLLYFIWGLIKQPYKIDYILALSLIIILSINFTRAYMLALVLGCIFLFTQFQWKRWVIYCAGALVIFFLSFTIIHLAASRGHSLGWEFFGIRLQSIGMPQIEDSSSIRLFLLPAILDKIQAHPILGNGLGDTVLITEKTATPQFDWGYLEIIDEMGAIGMIIWILFITCVIHRIFKSSSDQKRGLLASLVALLVINITSPALFHVMGVTWLTFLLSHASSKQPPSLDHIPQPY